MRMRASRAATNVQSTFVSSLPARDERPPITLSATVPRTAAVATRRAGAGVSSIPRARPRTAVRPLLRRPLASLARDGPVVACGLLEGWIRRGVRLKLPISDSAVSAKGRPGGDEAALKAPIRRLGCA